MTTRQRIAGSLFLMLGLAAMTAPVAADEAMLGHDRDVAVVYPDAPRNDRHRGWRGTRGCAPLNAMGQAEQEGIRRPTVADFNQHSVVVEGHGRFGWGRMVFANMPGCPLVLR